MQPLKVGPYQLTRAGLTFTSKLQKTRGRVMVVLPKMVTAGMDLRKGELVKINILWHEEKAGIWVELG